MVPFLSAADHGFGSVRHLAGRFVSSLRPGGPPPDDERWAQECLQPGEAVLWAKMSGPDRRHAIGVARKVADHLALQPSQPDDRPVLAAALLHDVGKVDARLGTCGRAVVTLIAIFLGRDRVAAWADEPGAGSSGLAARAGRYVTHDRRGADLLIAGGADPLTVAWAGEHHLPPEQWTVERPVADALKAADGD